MRKAKGTVPPREAPESIDESLQQYFQPQIPMRDPKERIDSIINEEVGVNKNTLKYVKKCVHVEFGIVPSEVDCCYINKAYIECCAKCWLEETNNFLKELIVKKNRSVFLGIFNLLDGLGDLNSIPKPLKKLKYYTLLMKHRHLIGGDEKKLLSQFKIDCSKRIVTFCASANNELVLLESLINFLNFSKSLSLIIAELKLKDFCSGNVPFHELTNKIMKLKEETYGENLKILRSAIRDIKEKDIFFIDKFREVVNAYVTPIRIERGETDNRQVVEVIGKIIVVSEILEKVEELLKDNNDSVEEVRFVNADMMHIDKNLENEVWHGKNILIVAKAINVHGQVTWDVSGKDNNHVYSDNAGTGGDGNGINGENGYPGESGGNVLIVIEKILNPEKFIVTSKGGRGSKGQDGGNGENGEDGKEMVEDELREKFLISEFVFYGKHITRVLRNISNLATIEIARCDDKNILINGQIKFPTLIWHNIFIQAKTADKNEIIFSFYKTPTFSFQTYFLYKGPLGKAGGRGGVGGFGGVGGYAGKVRVINPKKNISKFKILNNCSDGCDGEDGLGGFHGKHGKNARDWGYVHWLFWTEPVIYSSGDNNKLVIKYSSSCTNNCQVWCDNNKRYVQIERANFQTNLRGYTERVQNRQNSNRGLNREAVKKKDFFRNSIEDNYFDGFNCTTNSLQNDLKNSKLHAFKLISENQEILEAKTVELGIKRHMNCTSQSDHRRAVVPVITFREASKQNTAGLLEDLKREPQMLENWLQLRGIELNRDELNDLFGLLSNKSLKKLKQLQCIELLLIDKYRFATLQEIAHQLTPYQDVVLSKELTPQNESKYLIEAKQNDENILHCDLGNLNQHLYEWNEKLWTNTFEYCKGMLQSDDNFCAIFLPSLKAFILEVEESKNAPEKYTYKNETVASTLNTIGDDWKKCCDDEAILEEYNRYIQEKGPLSRSYRELLAYIFDINIRVYIKNKNNGLIIQDTHKHLSEQKIYILCRDQTYVPLKIDKDYLELEEKLKVNDCLYKQIFAEIKSFKLKKQFDAYVKKQNFPSNNTPTEDSQFLRIGNEIEEIMAYFPQEEKQLLGQRLKIIQLIKCIGSQDILCYMLKRFSIEGRHVSCQELLCLVNLVLTFTIKGRKGLYTFCWIIAAYSQKNWIKELLLLQLEDHLKKPLAEKTKWREFLSKVENKNILVLFLVKLEQNMSKSPIDNKCIEDILRLLSSIPNVAVSLDALELSEWPYALKEKYWTWKLSTLLDWREEDLSAASYYLLSIENIFGTLLAEKLIEALKGRKEINKETFSPQTLLEMLYNFHQDKWNLSEEELNALDSRNFEEWINETHKLVADEKDRDISQLVKLIKGNGNTSKEISNSLSLIENSLRRISEPDYMINNIAVCEYKRDDIKAWAVNFTKAREMQESNEEIGITYEKILALVERAIVLTKEIKLRDTQKLTVLALIANNRHSLAQVSTGEGKSLVVVTAAIIKALCREKVDIITSSSLLAKRDAADYKDIFDIFGIKVSHNCSEDIEKRKIAYSCQVIYGDLSSFQRDYLLHTFYCKNILGDHKFENVIVDEVDSMLLDKGNNIMYLSHDLAGLDTLESVYVFIWLWINRPAETGEEIKDVFNTKAIKEGVLRDLYGVIKKDIEKLRPELNERRKNSLWKQLIDAKILNDKGELVEGNISVGKLKEVLSPEFKGYEYQLGHLLKESCEREKLVHVSNNLRPFVELHLETWINNAITAFFMKPGENYVVDVDRTGASPDKSPNIIILDRDTGTDQANSQWEEALHQFLQLKHGCKLSLQSLKAVFISNVSFFKQYRNLYGLTGTLGSPNERDLLRQMYGVEYVTIPTAKFKRLHEGKPIICTTKEEWINRVHDEVEKLTEEPDADKKRSVLIICETVNDVVVLHEAFGGKNAKHVHTYTRDYAEFEVVSSDKELWQGQVIIATNLCGRGTDIKITEDLRKAGGLHVCLTYLPRNVRIEQQAFGRAARNGDPGSFQIIILDTKGEDSARIFDLKKVRDVQELQHISFIKSFYENQIDIEEKCFKMFAKVFNMLKKDLDDNKVPDEVKNIFLQSCLDKWAFWLDKHNTVDKGQLDYLIQTFISRLKNLCTGYKTTWLGFSYEHDISKWLPWVEDNPYQMVKLGRFLSQQGQYKVAIELFDKVIGKEPYFSATAHYYKAFALGKAFDWESNPSEGNAAANFKNELEEAARLFEEYLIFAVNAAGLIGAIKKHSTESIIQIDAYEKQQNTKANLYYIFLRSIDDILGHTIVPQCFVNRDINKNTAQILYENFLKTKILNKPRVKENFAEKKLKAISIRFGTSVGKLNDFLSKFRGKEIDENFQENFKEEVSLPSENEFWELLIKENVLSEEEEYIVVHGELPSNNEKGMEVKRADEQSSFIYSNAEWNALLKCPNHYIVKKEDLEKNNQIQEILSFRKARVDRSKMETAVFSLYDSITVEDFSKIGTTRTETETILEELIQENIIEKKAVEKENDVYGLKINFDKIAEIQLSSLPVYDNAVKGLLSICFTYRTALQKVKSRLDENENNSPVYLQLKKKPHKVLVLELLEKQIIEPSKVANMEKDVIKKGIEEALCNVNTEANLIELVTRTLERSTSSLIWLKVPDWDLLPLAELYGPDEIDQHIFSLNGFDYIVQSFEKKWTRAMLANTAIVIIMGLSQIAIGVAIEIYSVGVMTHVGSAFISEGVNDLFLAMGALTSGYFSWGDYRQQKLTSLMITTCTFGVGALFSRGVEVSCAGFRLAGPSSKLAKMSGSQLIKAAGWKQIAKSAAKRITLKAMEGVAFGLINVGVDTVIENYLQGVCNNIASCILSNIEQEVEKHKISESLEKLFKALGEKEARNVVSNLTESAFVETRVEKLMYYASNIAKSVIQGIGVAIEKASKTNKKLEFCQLIYSIRKVVVWSEQMTHIAEITNSTVKFLNYLDREIKNKFNVMEKVEEQEVQEDYESFKNEIITHWKGLLRQRAKKIIEMKILSPILKNCANCLVRYCANEIKKTYVSYKESGNLTRFETLKREYKEQLQQCDNNSETKDQITEIYHDKLIELSKNCRNPDLVAAAVREGIPMDEVCLQAAAQVLRELGLPNDNGMPFAGVAINVEGDGVMREEFSCGSEEGEIQKIPLELSEHHYSARGSESLQHTSSDSANDCLYDALSSLHPELRNRMTAGQFRNEVANRIQRDPNIRHHIEMHWHQHGAYGGRSRKKSRTIHDATSSCEANECFHEPLQHLVHRLRHFIRLAGTVHRISESSNVPRDQVVEGGASQYQDESCSIEGYEAGHLLRLGEINPDLSSEDLIELRNVLGHTQGVPKFVNSWHGIGGAIDQFQSSLFNDLSDINFNGDCSEEAREKLASIKNSYIDTITSCLDKNRLTPEERCYLEDARTFITENVSVDSLYFDGRDGYWGIYREAYQ